MNASFAGKKLLVVGGTSGMGFETAKLVLKNGGSVVLVGNRQDKAEDGVAPMACCAHMEPILTMEPLMPASIILRTTSRVIKNVARLMLIYMS